MKSDETAECICPYCKDNDVAPVCGSNGVTYTSECYLRAASCQKQTLITTSRNSPCSESL